MQALLLDTVAPAHDAAPASPPEPVRWGLGRRVGFRFAFVYFLLFALPIALSSVPGLGLLSVAASWAQDAAARWSARAVLGIARDLGQPNGSGDRLLNYVEALDRLCVAAVIALVWSVLDRRRTGYRYLADAFRVVLRYSLAITLLGYGLAKMIPPTQFPEPDVGRLMQPYGESSPMGLLWTFMGASQPYTFFGGLMEVAGGVLLLFRRTTLLGALVSIAVMTNVVVLNFCYDVPVKLYSLHYLAMAGLLALPDLGRLLNVFVLNRPVGRADLRMPLPRWLGRAEWWVRLGVGVAKGLLLLAFLGSMVWGHVQLRAMYSGQAAGPLDGGFAVERFERNGEELPPLLGDARRWRSFAVFQSRFASARTMGEGRLRFRIQVDAATGAVTFTPYNPDGPPERWTFTAPDADRVELRGTLDGQTLVVHLKRVDRNQFLLVNRGFHWVNDFPFNR